MKSNFRAELLVQPVKETIIKWIHTEGYAALNLSNFFSAHRSQQSRVYMT